MEQQYQNVQTEEGVSLMDIVKLLLSKIKLLILVVLIGGILGGSFAVWQTIDVNYFGTKVEFYVNPEKPEESSSTSAGAGAGGSQYGVYGAYGRHVMDNMVKLLSSDSFAEQLLLNGESLPDMKTQWFAAEDAYENGTLKNDALKAAIEKAQGPLENMKNAETTYNAALVKKAEAVKFRNEAERALNEEWIKLYRANSLPTASFSRDVYFDEKNPVKGKYDSLDAAYDNFLQKENYVTEMTAKAIEAEDALSISKKETKVPVEEALDIWRESALYAALLKYYKNAVSYSYLESDADFEDANNLARSFIYVKISIQNSNVQDGVRIGTELLNRVKKVVPAYVSENMTVPDGYSGTNCQRITRIDDVGLTNPLYTTKQAIKYAVLMAALAFVVAAVVIIILDKSDKRLRDTEIITRKFNVPLLGIVPTIEELKAETNAKKKAEKTGEVK